MLQPAAASVRRGPEVMSALLEVLQVVDRGPWDVAVVWPPLQMLYEGFDMLRI